MVQAQAPLPTIGSIAKRFDVPTHRVLYVVKTNGIKPVGRAGIARVFDESTVRRIGQELHRIARRGGTGVTHR